MLYAAIVKRVGVTLPLLSVVVFVACKKAPEPANTAGPSLIPPASTLSAKAPTAAPVANPGMPVVQVTWVDPPEWKRSEKVSPMRKATYVIPRASSDKEDGELGVFYFGPGQGGGIEANIDRWVKQFTDVKLEDVKRADRTVNGLVAHTVEIESGNFNANSMGRGDAMMKPGYGLLGAIVEAPSGAYFFKLTGPKATVTGAKPVFEKLIDGVRVSG